MLFTSYSFIFLFFPITFAGYFFINKKNKTAAEVWLTACSLAFYYFGSPGFFPWFILGICINYAVGFSLGKMQTNLLRKLVYIFGLLFNIGLLCYYKYMDFFITNYNMIFGKDMELMRIALPIGISFFTFQQIAFIVDSYRYETKEYSFLKYALFVAFFPQLIVGPIVHHKEIIPQFEQERNRELIWSNVSKGLFLFAVGCGKKMLLADPLTTAAQGYFGSLVSIMPASSWYYAIMYTVSYYFDLSGYADMAIGLGQMFNINIPHNFNSPYKATNFQDYWRRWHMTLSRFLGTYIFRGVYKKGSKYRNYYVATMVTFFVSGFWHGSGWTFVAWGLINGLFVCIAAYRNRAGIHAPVPIAWFVTALGIVGTRVLFVSDSFTSAWNVYKSMLDFRFYSTIGDLFAQIKNLLVSDTQLSLTLAIGILICLFVPNSKTFMEHFKTNWVTLSWAGAIMVYCLLNMSQAAPFLYFQF